MYCRNCGTQLTDGACFCAVCGTPTGQGMAYQPQPGQGAPYMPGNEPLGRYGNSVSGKKNKTAGIAAAVIGLLALVAVVLIIVFIMGGNSYKDAVNACMKGWVNQDLDPILEAVLPVMREDVKDHILWWYDSEEEMWADMDEKILSYHITEAERIGKDDLKYIEEMLEEWYGYECSITDGYFVDVEWTYRDSWGNKDTDSETFAVVKIKGKWYVSWDVF